MSEDEGKKESDPSKDPNAAVEGAAPPVVAEPVIAGGGMVAYRPNLEAEGEIAIIEKILAMRSVQKEEVSCYLSVCLDICLDIINLSYFRLMQYF